LGKADNEKPPTPLKFWSWQYRELIKQRDEGYLAVVEGDFSEFDKVGRWSWYKYELAMEVLKERYNKMKEQEKKLKNKK
jgi:hypothetical protein